VKAAAVTAGIWVDTTPPTVSKTAKSLFCATFDGKKGLQIGWSNIFAETGCATDATTDNDCLVYRYNVGTSRGAGNVVRWHDAGGNGADSEVWVDAKHLVKDRLTGELDLKKAYYVTVAAYNLAGIGVTATFPVQTYLDGSKTIPVPKC
jgi:hypothetical protein